MTHVVAIHRVTYGPQAKLVASGKIDNEGRMVMRREKVVHLPGTVFKIEDGVTLDYLLGLGSIRLPDEGDRQLFIDAGLPLPARKEV